MILISFVLAFLIAILFAPLVARAVVRMPDDEPFFKPPHHCHECKTPFTVVEQIPLIGYWLSKGICGSCNASRPKDLWFGEVLVFAATFAVFSLHDAPQIIAIDLLFLFALIVIALIDFREMIIEPRVVVVAIVLRVLWIVVYDWQQTLYFLGSMLVAAGAFYFIGLFYEVLRRRQGLGDGDAAVIGVIALWTGWEDLSLVVLAAAISGLLVGGGSLILNKKSIQNTQLPFAPSLCFGGVVVYLAQVHLERQNIVSLWPQMLG